MRMERTDDKKSVSIEASLLNSIKQIRALCDPIDAKFDKIRTICDNIIYQMQNHSHK